MMHSWYISLIKAMDDCHGKLKASDLAPERPLRRIPARPQAHSRHLRKGLFGGYVRAEPGTQEGRTLTGGPDGAHRTGVG